MPRASNPIQFVAIALQDEDWQHVEPKLAKNDAAEIRVNIARTRFPNERVRKICVLVHRDLVVGLCLARYLSRSGDVDYMAGIDYLHALHPATRINRFLRDLPGDVRQSTEQALRDGRTLTPREGDEVEATLRSDVLNAAVLDSLVDRLELTPDMTNHIARIRAEQRDALAMVLEVAGLPSKEVLRPADQLDGDDREAESPFLTAVAKMRSGERAVIRHDAKSVNGWEQLAGPRGNFDSVTFADPKSHKDKITVLYVDSEPLERITGTDLIYRRTGQPTFVMVQYKQMTREASGEVYRPDDQLRDQIQRMRSVSASSAEWLQSPHDYRLSSEACYMKLVTSDVRRLENNKLAEGMYFPLSLFERMIEDPDLVGRRGGQVITPQNAPKHLSNDLFVDLLKGGWIGTVGQGTETVEQILVDRLRQQRGLLIADHHSEPRAMLRARADP